MTAYFSHEATTSTLTLRVERGESPTVEVYNDIPAKELLIMRTVANHYGRTVKEFRSRLRTQPLAFQRQVAMAMASIHTNMPLQAIASIFLRLDHATIIHAKRRIDNALHELETGPEILAVNGKVIEALKGQ